MPRPRGGRSLAKQRGEEVDEEILEGDKVAQIVKRPVSIEQSLKDRFKATSAEKEIVVHRPLAEQPLSEIERHKIRRYREINSFLKQSPFYVREPPKDEHADMRRYTDKYKDDDSELLGQGLKHYVETSLGDNPDAFPAELQKHFRRKRKRDDDDDAGERVDERGVLIARKVRENSDSDDDGDTEETAVAANVDEDSDDAEYSKQHADMEGEDEVESNDEDAGAGGTF